MHRFTIQRKISDTLLGAAYECSVNHAPPPRTTVTTTSKPLPSSSSSVAIKCSSLAVREHLVRKRGEHDGGHGVETALDDPLRERRVAAALIASGGHPNVVQHYDHFLLHDDDAFGGSDDSLSVCVVTEFCEGGDLFAFLTTATEGEAPCGDGMTSPHGLGERTAVALLLQVARGVSFLHMRLGLAHRDLSLENVLLTRNGTCKLADFGVATSVDVRCRDRAGKTPYMAPEIVALRAHDGDSIDDSYDPAAADVWSLGVMLFMLLTGSQLVDVASHEDPVFRILSCRGVGAILDAWKVDASLLLVELLDAMLCVDPTQRPRVIEVVTQLTEIHEVAA